MYQTVNVFAGLNDGMSLGAIILHYLQRIPLYSFLNNLELGDAV